MSGLRKRIEVDADDRFVLRWALLAYRAQLRERAGTDAEQQERAEILALVESLLQRLA